MAEEKKEKKEEIVEEPSSEEKAALAKEINPKPSFQNEAKVKAMILARDLRDKTSGFAKEYELYEKSRKAKKLANKKASELSKEAKDLAKEAMEQAKKAKEKASVFSRWMRPKVKVANERAKEKGKKLEKYVREKAHHINEEYIEGTALDKHIDKIDHMMGYLMEKDDFAFDNDAMAAAKKPIRAGMMLFMIVFVFFGGWAACAPLDSAAIANGVIVLDANKKVVQHLEGGIISEILVREGDLVVKDQPLMRLNETNAKARVEILASQLRAAKAAEARLLSERDNMEEIVFDEYLMNQKDNIDAIKAMDAQERLFYSRHEAMESKIDIFKQRTEQLREEIIGLEAQKTSTTTQLELIKQEEEVVQKLVSSGQAVRPRLLALQRKSAELEGNRGEFIARIAQSKQAITENDLSIINLRNEFQSEVIGNLREMQGQIADLEERFRAGQDVFDRVAVLAPKEGIITGLKFHTIGGVIPPGAEILSIVPQNDELIIEAQVTPIDIDVVHKGLPAKVNLSAFKMRSVPTLKGEVTYVSADRFVDERTGIGFYKARVKIDKEMMSNLNKKIELYPGMPASVMIVTGSKTLLSYLLDPITDNFSKAFREQ